MFGNLENQVIPPASETIATTVGQALNYQKWLNQSAVGYLIKPYTARGIGGFVFTINDEDRLDLRADVTDYVSEDNHNIQSHIAIKPMVITLRGFIGELKNEIPQGSNGSVQQLEQKLTAVATYLPQFSQASQLAIAAAIKANQTNQLEVINTIVQSTENLASAFNVILPGQTRQEQAYSSLQAMFNTRQIVTVETPWGYFDNMAITSIVFEQDGKSKMVSDIVVTLKQMKFSSVLFRQPTADERNALEKLGLMLKQDETGEPISSVPLPEGNMLDAFNETMIPGG